MLLGRTDPRHYESDRTVHCGHFSKEGDTLVRWAAVEAIQRQTEPTVKAVKAGIIARRGKNARNIAKVAAARRMLEVVYYVLRDGHARASPRGRSMTRHPDFVHAG